MSIDTARQLHAELRDFMRAMPDSTAALVPAETFTPEQTDRMISALFEAVARQMVIVGQLIEAWPQAWPPPTT